MESELAIISYMDREQFMQPRLENEEDRLQREHRFFIEAFVEGHSGELFTVKELMMALIDIDFIDSSTAYEVLEKLKNEGLVEQLTEKNKTKVFRSKALPLSIDEVEKSLPDSEIDDLGRQAREDYNYTITRYKSKKKKYRLVTKF